MKSLQGQTILITRAAEESRAWVIEVERRQGKALLFPCLSYQLIDDAQTSAALTREIATAHWLAFTSPRAVTAFTNLIDLPLPDRIKIGAVGKATGKMAEQLLGRIDLTTQGKGAGELANALATQEGPVGQVLFPSSDLARPDFEKTLAAHEIEVSRVVVYRTIPRTSAEPLLDLAAAGVGAILLASPSAVTGLVQGTKRVPPEISIISIGNTTTAAVRSAGLHLTGEASSPSIEGLLEAIP